MGKFFRYRKGKTFYERPFVSNLKTISKMSILLPLKKFLRMPMQLIDARNDPIFQALFPKNSLDQFWPSAYKSCSMIGVKVIKIILPFESSWLCEYGFSALTEIKIKKTGDLLELTTKCGRAWQRRNLVSILFVPEIRHTHHTPTHPH